MAAPPQITPFRARLQPDGDIGAAGQYQHLSFVEVSPSIGFSADKIDRPFFGERMRQDQVCAIIRLKCDIQDGPGKLDRRDMSEGLAGEDPHACAL
jgi:hypothetical protein